MKVHKMVLPIMRRMGEKYFLIVSGQLKKGDYIMIERGDVKYSKYGLSVMDFVEAPGSITILREELVKREGGLENVIDKIKRGKFALEKKQEKNRIV